MNIQSDSAIDNFQINDSTASSNLDFDFPSYLHYIDGNDSGIPYPNASGQYTENCSNTVLDEFFNDFYEISSNEMSKSSTYTGTATPNHIPDILTFDDVSSNVTHTDCDFNLTEFYINNMNDSYLTNASITSPEHKLDFSNLTEQRQVHFDNTSYDEYKIFRNTTDEPQLDNLNDITESTAYHGPYEIFENETINANPLDESQTEQKPIVENEDFNYQSQSINVELPVLNDTNGTNENVSVEEQNPFIAQASDILSSILMDKNNRIVIVAKPLKTPKTKNLNYELNEINKKPTNIPFLKQSTVKRRRKQTFDGINENAMIVKPFIKRERNRKLGETTATVTTNSKSINNYPETPKFVSKYMSNKRRNVTGKKFRKINIDTDSDCENHVVQGFRAS